jgi:hypothetical protein
MPAVSQAQFRWLHTKDAAKALGKSGVAEWIGATGSPKNLPKKKGLGHRALERKNGK